MVRFSAGFLLLVVSLVSSGCASESASSGVSANDSLIMIGVDLRRMNPDGTTSDQGENLVAISFREVTTGQVYRASITGGDQAVAVLPAGVYCLNELNPFDSLSLSYCREPLFKLEAGKVENAGYFVFSIDYKSHQLKLSSSLQDMKNLEMSLNRRERNLVEKFRKDHEIAVP